MDKEEIPFVFVTTAISHTELTFHLIWSSTFSTVRFSVCCSYFVLRRSQVEVLFRRRALRDMIFTALPWFPLDKWQNSTVNITKASPIFIIDYSSTVRHFLLTASSYRMIKTSLCTWWLQYRTLQVMFKVSPASLQTFIDKPNSVLEDRVQYSTVHIPNVFCDGHLQISHRVGIVCTVIVRCTEIFWSPCISREQI
jgi:hypothetical protein